MPTDFDEDIKHWRDISPPDTLKPRIAAALAPRPSFRLKPAFAAFAAAAAVAAFVALLPGSPARPSPVFADIRQAMSTVKNIAWTEREQHYDLTGTLTSDRTDKNWLRRAPAAWARQTEENLLPQTFGGEENAPHRELFDETGWRFMFAGGRIVRQNFAVFSLSGKKTDFASSVEERVRLFAKGLPQTNGDARAGYVGPQRSENIQTDFARTTVNGKPALKITRVAPALTGERPLPVGTEGAAAISTVWVDQTTKRVVQRETRFLFKSSDRQPVQEVVQTSTDFVYDTPAPPGTFDWPSSQDAKAE